MRYLLCLLWAGALFADTSVSVGYLGAWGMEEDGWTRSEPYLTTCNRFQKECENGTLYGAQSSTRLSFDFAQDIKGLQVRSLFFHTEKENWTLKVGVQEIAWGETFGLYIADLVDPRDYTDPFFNELCWIRLPNCTANLQLYRDPWHFQFVWTPIPRNNWLPGQNSPFNIFTEALPGSRIGHTHHFQVGRLGNDSEYGLRTGYLFENGLDVTGFYLRHWNRNPIYQLEFEDRPIFDPYVRRINTIGISYTKAFECIVLRGDSVLHFKEPWWPERVGVIEKRNVWQTILGADWTQGNATFGLQYHCDLWKENAMHWMSAQWIQTFCDDRYQSQIFIFKGLNNRDLWIQPELTRFFDNGLKVSLRADLLWGKKDGFLPKDGMIGPFRDKSRLLVWITKDL